MRSAFHGTMVSRSGSQGTQYKRLPFVEPLDGYRPGGFHPTHLGDSLNSGKYIVLNKLGYGVSSTVWLARDTRNDKAVALSILKSEVSRATAQRQLVIQQHLHDGDSSHPGHSIMLIPIDDFEIDGPNGQHSCFVTPVMGPSIGVATRRGQGAVARGLPLHLAKRAVFELANGISYMTSQGVVHGGMLHSVLTYGSTLARCFLRLGNRSSHLEFAARIRQHSDPRSPDHRRFLWSAKDRTGG